MPAKLSPVVANKFIEEISQEKDVTFISGFVNSKTSIHFLCKECGQETKITWGQLQQGKNPNMLCVDCSYKQRSKTQSLSYDDLKAEIESKGSLLLTPHTVKLNTHTDLTLICTRCGDTFILRYGDYKRGRNKNLRCSACAHVINGNHLAREANRVSRDMRRQQSYADIKFIVESVGATLLTSFEDFESKTETPIHFGCSSCGKEYWINWKKFEEGQNPKLLCKDCLPEKNVYNTDLVKAEFAEHDVKLLNSYKNIHSPLLFNCKQCGKLASITWGRYVYLGRNKYFLCRNCLNGNSSCDPFAPVNADASLDRTKAESQIRFSCKLFYNISVSDRSFYESHHIKPVKNFPSLKYSLGNLYPLLKIEHHTNNFSYYHYLEEARNPENWDDAVKLPYHNYSGFKFLDLNAYFQTDFIFTEDRNLFARKKSFAEKGIMFIPLYFPELDDVQKSFIVFSMLRSRLAKIPEIGMNIYNYTGQKFVRYNTRKLDVRLVPVEDALYFFEKYHIQGYADALICLGLYDKDTLVSAMSFGVPRNAKWIGHGNYEMIRFCSVLNSSVPGAASKLFNFFVMNYQPNLVVTFCDCRFSSVDPMETVYPKLGFEYDGYSKPNYKYYKDGKLYSRQHFMKKRLASRLENYDPDLSELQNMHNNGYLRLYDCGNFRFVWRRPQSL